MKLSENTVKGLPRKEAARIIHDFLRTELREADETDGSPAYILRDLFDCRVCAGHIIQVYVKGIMDGVALPDGNVIFAADKAVSESEAEEVVVRVFQKELRISRSDEKKQSEKDAEPEEISPERVKELLRENKNVLLADVRTEREYEQGHWENAINIPFLSLIKNPFVLSESRDKRILLYCNEGYQSKAAAQCLLETGYENVAFFAWKERKQ